MALNIDTQDLANYPGTTKRVSVDLESIVPVGYEGDEQFVLSFSTSAYSNNTSRTSIQDLYTMRFISGWCKSSGFTGSNGKFSITPSANSLLVKIDATTGGSSGYYTISLETSDTPIGGEAIAADIEEKIRNITLATADVGFTSAYTNTTVEFTDGRFWIVSGSMSNYYTGSDRSSVRVMAAASNDCSKVLGFDLSTTSEELAGVSVKEAYLVTNYTIGDTTITISPGTGVAVGDCMMIVDGTNKDYFTVISGSSSTVLVVPTLATHNYNAIQNNYTTVSGAKLQLLREQDPDSEPYAWYNSVDSIIRHGIKVIINQIDYSS
jgi:hypothetical protein